MLLVRLLVVLALVVMALPAVEQPLAIPVSFRLEYANGTLALRDGETSQLTGGVQVWYEDIHLHSDRLDWTQSVFPGVKRPLVDRLDLLPGPAGPTPERILIDSSASHHVGVGFRGKFMPTEVHIERRAPDPAHPTLVHWRVVMVDVQFFSGLLETSGGWIPHAGWASEIEAELVADVVGDHLENQRFTTIHLFSKTAAEAAKRRRVRLDRLLTPLAKAEDLADLPSNAAEFGMQSDIISMYFNARGQLDSIKSTTNTTIYGVPPNDMSLGLQSRVEPGK